MRQFECHKQKDGHTIEKIHDGKMLDLKCVDRSASSVNWSAAARTKMSEAAYGANPALHLVIEFK